MTPSQGKQSSVAPGQFSRMVSLNSFFEQFRPKPSQATRVERGRAGLSRPQPAKLSEAESSQAEPRQAKRAKWPRSGLESSCLEPSGFEATSKWPRVEFSRPKWLRGDFEVTSSRVCLGSRVFSMFWASHVASQCSQVFLTSK